MDFTPGLKKYGSNVGYLMFEKVLRIFVAVIVWTQVIRYLGPEQFGLVSYALSFIVLFSILSDLGLESVVVKELVTSSQLKGSILGSTFFLQFFGSLLAIVLMIITTALMGTETHLMWIILILSLRLVFQSFNNITFYFLSQVLSKYIVFSQIIAMMITSFLYLYFVHCKLPLIYFIMIMVLEVFIASIGSIFYYFRCGETVWSWKVNFSIIKKLFMNCWPLILSGIAVSIYMRIDQVMIKEMLGTKAVGYFSAAVRVSEAIYFLPMILTSAVFPAIVKSKLNQSTDYAHKIQALFSLFFWLSGGVSLALFLTAPWIVQVLFGPEFTPSVNVIRIHAWANIFIFWVIARSKWSVNENIQHYIMAYTIGGAILNILLNLWLIPRYSIEGAAWATVIAYLFSGVLFNLIFAQTREIFFIQLKSLNPKNIFIKGIFKTE